MKPLRNIVNIINANNNLKKMNSKKKKRRKNYIHERHCLLVDLPGGGALGYILGGYVPPGTPNWHPVLKRNSPKIDTPF